MPDQQTTTDTISEQPKSSCFKKHYPRVPYTYTQEAFDNCCEECDRPGIGSSHFQGGSMSQCPLCCIPCTLIGDLVLCIPRIFGYCALERT